MGKASQVEQSPADRERQSVASQILGDWQQRWAPMLKTFSENTIKALEPGSAERKRATAMAGTDVAVGASNAQQRTLQQAGQSGALGSAKQKLAVTSIGDAQATQTALSRNDADQAVTDAGISGLQTVVSQGQGIKRAAVGGFNRAAELGEAHARADAGLANDRRAGYAQLGGTVAGMGLGWFAGQSGGGTTASGGTLNSGYVDPTTGATLNNPSAWVTPG